jgi:hypothetical protein
VPEPDTAELPPLPPLPPARLTHPGLNLGTVPEPEPTLDAESGLDPEAALNPEPTLDAESGLELGAVPELDAVPELETVPDLEPVSDLEPPLDPPPAPKPPAVRRIGIMAPVTDRQYTMAPEPGTARQARPAGAWSPPGSGDDIFATFSGPDPRPVVTGPLPTQSQATPPVLLDPRPGHDPDGAPRTWDWGWGRHSPRRVLIAVAAFLAVAVVVLLAQNLTGRGRPAAQTPAKKADPRAAAVADFGGTAPTGLTRMGSPEASDALRKAGQTGPGTIVEAWTWKDQNGTNLVVSARIVRAGQHQSLKVIHLSRLETDRPRPLRIMTDPDLPDCAAGGTAEFTKNSLLVRDLNADGIAEIAAGWTSRCEGAKASQVRLALITNGDKYIVRGKGVIGGAGGTSGAGGTKVPDPKASAWPPGFNSALDKLFSRLYY